MCSKSGSCVTRGLLKTEYHTVTLEKISTVRGSDPRFGILRSPWDDGQKKEELTRWHSDQVHRNVSFNFRQKVIAYCQSDMALLKAGCNAFQQEFQSQAGFKPMEKFLTIANACNLYWRKHHLPPKTIAVEPVRGWRGPMSAIPSRPCNGSITRNNKFPSRGPVRTGSNKSAMVGNSLRERLSRRWVRCPHTHCLRVPRVSLPCMPT